MLKLFFDGDNFSDENGEWFLIFLLLMLLLHFSLPFILTVKAVPETLLLAILVLLFVV